MGAVKNQKHEARDASRERRAAKRAEKRQALGTVDANALPWLTIVAFMAEMAANQGAVRFGFTRDGGALALGCYMGDDYDTEYIRPNQDIEAAIFDIADVWLPDGLLGLERRLAQLGAVKTSPDNAK